MSDGEVTLVCQVDLLHLPDLGLRLTRGSRVSIPMTAAMKSRDLSKAKIDGTVVTQTVRSSVIRAQERVSSDTVTSQSPRASAPALDLSPLLGAIQQLTDEVRALRADMASRGATYDLAPLVQQLQGVISTGPSPAARVEQTEAVFIPSNLTGGDLSASLNVTSDSNDDPGLVDAMRALKAAKKKR